MSTTPQNFNDGLDRRPSAPIVHQVEGGKQIIVTPEAQQAAYAAALLSQYDQQLTKALTKGFNKLDPKSQENLDELMTYMRSNQPKPATIINLHPWPLVIDGPRLLKGIMVPACPPGARFAHVHVRGWRKDWEYDEDGSLKFKAILPIKLAGEFVREFSSGEFGKNNGCNGGVIIYEGESHPDKVGEVECYDANGRLLTRDEPGVDYEGEQQVPVIRKIPIKRKLAEILHEATQGRNAYYFKRVQRADSDYRDEKKRAYIDLSNPRLMAEVLHAEGLLPVVPVWNLATRMQQGLADDNCPACAAPRKVDAIMCHECKHPLEPVECYANGIITWDQLEMHNLSADEWEQAMELKTQKDSAKEEAMKRIAEKNKAQDSSGGKSAKGKDK